MSNMMKDRRKKMHPATESIIKHFSYDHLSGNLKRISKKFSDLAIELAEDETLSGAELTVGLRKLLEAKDCAVRAAVPME
jgi:hypothetical protein